MKKPKKSASRSTYTTAHRWSLFFLLARPLWGSLRGTITLLRTKFDVRGAIEPTFRVFSSFSGFFHFFHFFSLFFTFFQFFQVSRVFGGTPPNPRIPPQTPNSGPLRTPSPETQKFDPETQKFDFLGYPPKPRILTLRT